MVSRIPVSGVYKGGHRAKKWKSIQSQCRKAPSLVLALFVGSETQISSNKTLVSIKLHKKSIIQSVNAVILHVAPYIRMELPKLNRSPFTIQEGQQLLKNNGAEGGFTLTRTTSIANRKALEGRDKSHLSVL